MPTGAEISILGLLVTLIGFVWRSTRAIDKLINRSEENRRVLIEIGHARELPENGTLVAMARHEQRR